MVFKVVFVKQILVSLLKAPEVCRLSISYGWNYFWYYVGFVGMPDS